MEKRYRYAAGCGSHNQQITFYEKMINSIRCCQTENMLIGGDFNCPLSALDKFGGKEVETRFTWRNSSGKIKCRLDFWLTSKRL